MGTEVATRLTPLNLALAAAAAVAVIWAGLSLIAPNADWLYALSWGDSIVGGELPNVLHANAPLVDPLSLFVGVLLGPVPEGAAFDLVSIIAIGSWALLAYGAFRLARALVGADGAPGVMVAAGALATLLVLSRGLIDHFALRATIDVPFTGLVMIALSLILEAPRSRPILPLALLALAGLLRPEAWLLAVIYVAWLAHDGLRRPRRTDCVCIAAAPIVVWLLIAGILSDDPLAPITGNPEAVGNADLGFQGGLTATTYPSGLDLIADSAVDRVRSIIGDELALAGLMAVLFSLLSLADPRRRTPRALRFALTAALVPVLMLQSILFTQLGAPLSDRYLLAPAAILIVLVAAMAWSLATPRRALVASAILVALAFTAPIGGRGLTAPTQPKVRYALTQSEIERDEQEDLYELAAKPQVQESFDRGCDELTLAGRGGPHYMLAAKPLLAHRLDVQTEDVLVKRKAEAPETGSANFLRRVTYGPLYVITGDWVFQSPCML
jgi:hypothetical protein